MSETVTAVSAVHPSTNQPRGERGRFAEKPSKVRTQAARLQAAFIRTLSEDDVEAIARKLIEQAREGDNTSARLVLKYGLGELLPQGEQDWELRGEAAVPARASAPPSAEQVMAAIQTKLREQQALEADILGRGPNPAPRPVPERRPGEAAAGRR